MSAHTQRNEFQVGPLMVSVRTDTWAAGDVADGPVSATVLSFRNTDETAVCFLSYDATDRQERFRLVNGLQVHLDMDPGPEALDWADALEQVAELLRVHHRLVVPEGEPE